MFQRGETKTEGEEEESQVPSHLFLPENRAETISGRTQAGKSGLAETVDLRPR